MSSENIILECGVINGMLKSGYFNDILTDEEIQELEIQLPKIKNNEQFFELSIFKENIKIYNMMIKKLSGKNEANNAPPCGICGSDRFYVDLQRRSGDEARNFEIHCPGCNSIQFL